MKILCLSDIHFVSKENYSPIPERNYRFGIEFIERVLKRENGNFHLLVICGDFTDNADIETAEDDFLKIKEVVEKNSEVPFIFIRGNHDIEIKKFLDISGKASFPLIMDKYVFYPFHDIYRKDNKCYRSQEEINKFSEFCLKYKDKKVITLQHNTVYPEIEADYPYNIENREEILNLYKENNVILSISGHYHRGLEVKNYGGIYFLTLPALCESPFSYYIIKLDGNIEFEKKHLYLKHTFPLIDFHCHTEFAYCGENVESRKNIERAKLFGLDGIVLTEHSGQLYLLSEDYWNYRFLNGIDIIYRAKKEGNSRMEKFREKILPLKNDYVKVGMEVECDKNGEITLLPEDREGIDYLIGAVHYLPDEYKVSKEKVKKGFLKFTEFLCRKNIDILAHPLRFFIRNKMEVPGGIYEELVRILREYNVAAELNFHTNKPDPGFFHICAENGVKISPGSDSHNLLEVGEFSKHIKFLENLHFPVDKILFEGKKR